jgi:hypothetical protein
VLHAALTTALSRTPKVHSRSGVIKERIAQEAMQRLIVKMDCRMRMLVMMMMMLMLLFLTPAVSESRK